MRERATNDAVEVNVGPHAVRAGWEVARITYDAANPQHLAQIEAAITAMFAARGGRRPAPAVPGFLEAAQ